MLDSQSAEPAQMVHVRDPAPAPAPLQPMDDAEFAAVMRVARGFAEGGLFKDVKSAGAAFTKILAGRDLGLTPFEAMSGLHVIEGKVEAGSDLHATKVRQREGYDYRVAWLKVAGPPARQGAPPEVEVVWADEEELDDLRETYGCAVVFTVNGKPRGVSRWTEADTQRAELEKPRGSARSNHQKYPRNMYFSRAMTNGVAWHVPEVMNGMRVYGVGEISRGGEDVAAGTVDYEEGAEGLTLPLAAEAVLARARSLNHAGIASRAAAEFALKRCGTPDEVRAWVDARTRDLDRFAAGKPEPEPPDAEVVEEPDELAHPDTEPQPPPAQQPVDAPDEEMRDAMRRRANDLLNLAVELDERGESARAEDARSEAESLMEEAGPPPEDPEQQGLPL